MKQPWSLFEIIKISYKHLVLIEAPDAKYD